ncbi:MAG TPA: cytochrome c biogenesis protein CcdA, partial [Bdellovibrio sp.]|nr:cytochrome c biogenesis protein CcdA [Bdellovibrio sp.]
MKFAVLFFSIITCFATSPKSWALDTPNETDPLIASTKVLPYEWNPGQGGSLEIKMKLPAKYHAYEDKFSKKNRRGVRGEATLTTHIEAPDRFLKKYEKLKLELTYQACSDQFCLFPTKKMLEVPIVTSMVEGSATLNTPTPETTSSEPTGFFDTHNFKKYLGSSLLAGLFFVFFAGIFTSFTPCIFPMIPITLAVLGNHSEERTRLQNFVTSLIYVFGIATTYSLLGLVAASSGGVFGASLGNPWVLGCVCIIFLTMALSMYGLFEIQVPAFLRNRLSNGKHGQGFGGAYLTGLFAGIVASPCVGPVLVAILTYVASTQNKLIGFLFLFTYALGLGLIFIVLGLSNQLVKTLPRSGPWMIAFKFVLGTLMLSAFYYYLNLLFPDRLFDGALGVGLVIIASIYGAFMSVKNRGPVSMMQKGIMQATLIVGIGYLCLSVFDLRPYINGRI